MEGAAVISYSFGYHENFAHCIRQTIKAHLIYFSSGSNDFNLNPNFSGKEFLIVIVLCMCIIIRVSLHQSSFFLFKSNKIMIKNKNFLKHKLTVQPCK